MSDKPVKWLRREIERRGWSIRETARRAGVSHTAINNALSAHVAPTIETYRGLSRAFDMPLEDVLRLAEELPPTPQDAGESDPLFGELLYLYQRLPPGDQRTALRLLRGLASSAETTPEAARAQRLEQTFYSQTGGPPSDPDATGQMQVIHQLFNALASLSTAEDLEWAAEWFRRARESEDEKGGNEDLT